MKLNNDRGIALIMSLFILVVLLGLSVVFILRTVHESNMAKLDLDMAKSFYISEGGSNVALDGLDNLVNNYLLTTINATNPSVVISDAQSHLTNGIGWLIDNVIDTNGNPALTLNGAQGEFIDNGALGSGNYQYEIILTAKGNPVTVNPDTWDFPYNYRVESSGSYQNFSKDVLLSGDFTVRVQRDNFAKYALFTNNQQTPGGTNVWFTDNTNFAGPVHTNSRFNLYGNPSGTFNGLVEQVEQDARFYNSGSPILLDADFNGVEDVPTFNAGFNRGVGAISTSSAVAKQDLIDQATGNQIYSTDGIYVSDDGSGNLTGGIYVRGDSTVNLSVNGSDQAVYSITQGGTTKNITVDHVNGTTAVETVGVGTTNYQGVPDGIDDVGTIIYVDGNVTSLSGTVQRDTEVTLSMESDVVVQNHIHYSDYTPATGTPGQAGYVPPTASGAKNLLGIVSWAGNVRIGTSAPDNVDIHGTLLSSSGIFTVDNYNDQGVGPRGTATLLGGVITDDYGAFGLFNGGTGQYLSGYGRNFVYDDRMLVGSAPPYFPSLNTFVAFTNDITDKTVWQDGGASL